MAGLVGGLFPQIVVQNLLPAVLLVLMFAPMLPVTLQTDGAAVIAAILAFTVGYGAIAALGSHLYSRIALRRLRALAQDARRSDGGGDSDD